MKRIAAFVALALFVGCYTRPPPCDPSTIDWPACIDPTQPALADAGAPRLGASLLYPGGSVRSISITDSTATGRSLLTCASAAACRTALGLSNIDTFENSATAWCNSVVAFTYTPKVIYADAFSAAGGIGSRWTNLISGTAARTIITAPSAQERGGGQQYTTGATASSEAQWIPVSNGLGAFSMGVADDLVAATSKWCVQWDFAYQTTPDAQAGFGLGWINPNGTSGPVLGVQGSGSTTLFRLYTRAGAGTSSNVTIDNKRHRARMWHDGGVAAGTINWSIDGVAQTPVTGYAWGQPAGPYGNVFNGSTAAAQTVRIYEAFYAVDGVLNPPP